MGNKIMQETTPLVECSAFHRGMSVLEASLRNTEIQKLSSVAF